MLHNTRTGNMKTLTLKALQALQTFPSTYRWGANRDSDVRKMIGNAVPPLMAAKIIAAARAPGHTASARRDKKP
jgi:site-specific DNA-cytosine methylase